MRRGVSHPEPARVLRACRRFVVKERDLILESHCKLTYRLKPLRETLEPEAKPYLRTAESLIRRIDAALERLKR